MQRTSPCQWLSAFDWPHYPLFVSYVHQLLNPHPVSDCQHFTSPLIGPWHNLWLVPCYKVTLAFNQNCWYEFWAVIFFWGVSNDMFINMFLLWKPACHLSLIVRTIYQHISSYVRISIILCFCFVCVWFFMFKFVPFLALKESLF